MINYLIILDFSPFIIPILTFIAGYIVKVIYERYTLTYKLKIEYTFEQKKKLKEDISKNKTALLNATERLNHRLWNFSQHPEKLTTKKEYYQKSFLKIILNLLSICDTIENEIKAIDPSNGSKEDQNFLKYVKVFKDILTDKDLFRGFIDPYNPKGNFDKETYHQRKSDLQELILAYKTSNENEKNTILNQLLSKTDSYSSYLDPTINENEKHIRLNQLFSKIETNSPYSDPTINVFKSFHIISINFLNNYGLDYQKTEKDKMIRITRLYRHGMKSTKPLKDFLQKSKLSNEFKEILRSL